jgi:2-oxoglutarate dehydrogenase E1 component
MAILLHGDAAFAGYMSSLKAWPGSAASHRRHHAISSSTTRSVSHHCAALQPLIAPPTDIALISVPIFHVNGDDPQLWCTPASPQNSAKVPQDVVLDIILRHRRFGHNRATSRCSLNLLMYKRSNNKDHADAQYGSPCQRRPVPEGEIEGMKEEFQAYLAEEFDAAPTKP